MGVIPREKILDRVRQIVLAEIGDSEAKVYLFGSWARGEERRSSDIDVALRWPVGESPDIWVRLREVLEECDVPYRIEVVNMAEADGKLIDKICQEGVLWKG